MCFIISDQSWIDLNMKIMRKTKYSNSIHIDGHHSFIHSHYRSHVLSRDSSILVFEYDPGSWRQEPIIYIN
ncbi:hypothetical protein DERP_002696 [Dermatophagoides pteronyssinus]|uniref:Uncharacterized protein n=1 Tax=Dermatophagoides pteronyssinus TaxID=6956 RepID=A0ABQ8JWH9_DERPT|nr:hypothetical protein DERP_002696 [Dermatophagoides pteronyssinus]